MNPASVKIYKKHHGLNCDDNMKSLPCNTLFERVSKSPHLSECVSGLYLYLWHRLCTLRKICHAAVDPVISSGNLAICRQIRTFTSAPEPLTYIIFHIRALLCSLSGIMGPELASHYSKAPAPLKLTVADHLAMHVKSSHGPRPSHSISKYNPQPPSQNLHLSLLLKFNLLLVS